MIDGLVSVVMPSWNTAQFIAESIRSVLAQTYENLELLIVDDCSTDDTDAVVASFGDERIRYFKNETNVGAALSRNRALREARGEWIAFLDSDDLWTPDKLDKQIAFMKEKNAPLSYTEYDKIDETGNPLGITVSGPRTVDRKKMYRYDYVGQLTMVYNAGVFGLIQIGDVKKNNDYAIRLQLFRRKGTVALLLEETLAHYRVRKVSISHDKLSKKLRSHYDLFRVCDGRSAVVSFLFACRNMWFGLLKKKKYEKNRRSD